MAPRQEIITLLRGQVACPLISCIGELGWIEQMVKAPFDRSSLSADIDPAVFKAVMAYLTALQLVEPYAESGFIVTSLGRTVLSRYGAFCVLNSYENYMGDLRSLLVPDGSPRPVVNRVRNVIGSGAIHERKFFGAALELIGDNPREFVADIGCGSGQFLRIFSERFPSAALLGVDLSPAAVEQTLQRLHRNCEHVSVSGCISDGADVRTWSQKVPRSGGSGQVLISLWFLVHEISRSDPEVVVEFFNLLRHYCPDAAVLVGEVARVPEGLLAANRAISVMPELTLLHDLSGQGLLGWTDWEYIAAQIPYTKLGERVFDIVSAPGGTSQPSSFVWYLAPA